MTKTGLGAGGAVRMSGLWGTGTGNGGGRFRRISGVP